MRDSLSLRSFVHDARKVARSSSDRGARWKSKCPSAHLAFKDSDNQGFCTPAPDFPSSDAMALTRAIVFGFRFAWVSRCTAPFDRPVTCMTSDQVRPVACNSVTMADRISDTPFGGRPLFEKVSHEMPCLSSSGAKSACMITPDSEGEGTRRPRRRTGLPCSPVRGCR